jgi:hypothetical protein
MFYLIHQQHHSYPVGFRTKSLCFVTDENAMDNNPGLW